jgi:hypothetical protein
MFVYSFSATVSKRAEQLPKSFPKVAHGICVDAVAGPWTINFSRDQTGILQGFQVLRNRCLG